MKEIYIPNLFRYENLMEISSGNSLSEIPYFIDFNMNDKKQFSAFVQYEIAKVMENILLFDRVYVDSIVFPLIVDILYKEDENATIDLLKKGYLSFLNIGEFYISTIENSDGKYSIAYSKGRSLPFKSNDVFKNYILSYGDKKKKNLKRHLKTILSNSKTLEIELDKYGKETVHIVDSELKNGVYKELGIGLNGNYGITKSNKGVFDAICQVVKSDTICSILGINNIYYHDSLLEISKARVKEYKLINKNFNDILELEEIPNICTLYLEGNLNISDIISLKSTREIKSFNNWLTDSNNGDKDTVIKNYYQATKKQSKLDTIPVKGVRYLATEAAGLIPVVGTVVGAIDSFVLDEFKSKTPNMFFECMQKRVNKNIKTSKELEELIVPVKNKIEIDLSKEHKLDTQDIVYRVLNYLSNEIHNTDDEQKIINLLQDARKSFSNSMTLKNLEVYTGCMLNATCKSNINPLILIKEIESYILQYNKIGDKKILELLQSRYIAILINSITSNSFDEKIILNNELMLDEILLKEYIVRHIFTINQNNNEDNIKIIKKLISIYLYLTKKSTTLIDISKIIDVDINPYNGISYTIIE